MQRGGTLLALALTLAGATPAAAGQPGSQPDLSISGRSDPIGARVYNDDGTGQQRSFTVDGRLEIMVVLENTGGVPERFVVTAGTEAVVFDVQYRASSLFGHERNVTSAVTNEGLAKKVEPGNLLFVAIVVRSRDDAELGAVQRLVITARSATDPELIDAVKMKITNVASPPSTLTVV